MRVCFMNGSMIEHNGLGITCFSIDILRRHGCLLICLSIEIFMSKLDHCFVSYKISNVHAKKKRICDEHVRQHSTSKILFFIIYLLEDEQELSLGMLIRLQRIYNFLLFHDVILSFLDVLQSFYSNFISIFGTTLLT